MHAREMMKAVASLVLLRALLCTGAPCTRRVCHYDGDAARRGNGYYDMRPSEIPDNLCTHVIFDSASIVNDRLFPAQSDDEALYTGFNDRKKSNPSMKTLLSVGGKKVPSSDFSYMVQAEETRRTFISSSISFLRSKKFDGLDINWETPGSDSDFPDDKQFFTNLIVETAAAFKTEATEGSRPALLLTVTVPATKKLVEKGFDVHKIAKAVDFVNLKSFNFYKDSNLVLRHPSPLHGNKSVSKAVTLWLERGCSPDKLVVGLSARGRAYTPTDPGQTKPGSAASGVGTIGTMSGKSGYPAAFEVCSVLGKDAVMHTIGNKDYLPYLVNEEWWIGYEDEASLAKKVEFMQQLSLGGVALWSLDTDDFRGRSCPKAWPLLHSIYSQCSKGVPPTTPSPTETLRANDTMSREVMAMLRKSNVTFTAASNAIPTRPPNPDFCQDNPPGIHSFEFNCRMFYLCGENKHMTQVRHCPVGSSFRDNMKTCVTLAEDQVC